MKSSAHNEAVIEAEKKGFYITDTSYGVTVMAKTSIRGSMIMLHICQDTGNFLGSYNLENVE